MTAADADVFERAARQQQRKPAPNGQGGTGGTVPDLSAVPLTPAAWLARDLPKPDPIMGELFTTTSRILFAADTGLGKSMVALALAVAMSQGRDFLHWRAHRPARVLVLDGEMPRDLLQERIALACAWFDLEPPKDGLFILSREDVEDMPPLDSEEGAEWLLGVVALLKPDFVIFDNVMSLTGGDLREETTWRALVPLSRALSRDKVGQLWLHHVGHDKTKPYGSRLFAWQMDAVILGEAVTREGADVSVRLLFQKARRRTPDNRGDFETVHVTLADGTWSGTAAGTGTDEKLPRRPRLSPSGTVALDALDKALNAAGERPPDHDITRGVSRAVRLKTWRLYFAQVGGYGDEAKDKEAERKAWNRGRENACATANAVVWGEWVWRRS
jgi:hypothetical protein